MNAKTMEGLVGASTNTNLINTPMRVFREAERRGDTGTMERAMGYVGDFSDKAEEYKTKADKGMEEEAREKVKLEREETIRKRKEEREKPEEQVDKNRSADTVEISEEGKILLKNSTHPDNAASDETKTSTVKEPVIC